MNHYTYLLLDYGVKNPMDIFGHSFGIAADINITTFRDYIPDVTCLQTINLTCLVSQGNAIHNSPKKWYIFSTDLLRHLVLHIFLSWPLTRESDNHLRNRTRFKESVQFILINEILKTEHTRLKFSPIKHNRATLYANDTEASFNHFQIGYILGTTNQSRIRDPSPFQPKWIKQKELMGPPVDTWHTRVLNLTPLK